MSRLDRSKPRDVSHTEAVAAARQSLGHAIAAGAHYEIFIPLPVAAELFSLAGSRLDQLADQHASMLIMPGDTDGVHVVIIRPELRVQYAPSLADRKTQISTVGRWLTRLKSGVQSSALAVQQAVITESAHVLGLVEAEGVRVTGMLDPMWGQNEQISEALEGMRSMMERNDLHHPPVELAHPWYGYLWTLLGVIDPTAMRRKADLAPEYLFPPDTALSPPS